MGAFLEKPQTEKVNSGGEGVHMRYSVSAMQGGRCGHNSVVLTLTISGWRVDMEDAHTVCLGLNTDASTSTADHDTPNACDAQHTKCPVSHRWAFFAVFDGHAGNKVPCVY
jgi:hypothetical protein